MPDNGDEFPFQNLLTFSRAHIIAPVKGRIARASTHLSRFPFRLSRCGLNVGTRITAITFPDRCSEMLTV